MGGHVACVTETRNQDRVGEETWSILDFKLSPCSECFMLSSG